MSRILFWAPRALSILFIALVSVFAFDVFQEGRGFWQILGALAVNLIPSFLLIGALVVAWRWEWVGAVVFTVLAILLAIIARAPWWGKAILAAPCLLTAGLFLLDWRSKRKRPKLAN